MRSLAAIATAISSRRCSPCDRLPASSLALADRSNWPIKSSTRAIASRLLESGRSSPRPCSRNWAAKRRFSRKDSSKNRLVIWNERANPALSIRLGATPVTSMPPKRTLPAVGCSAPLIRLNKLLLPAPFGPIKAVIAPCCASKLTWLTAYMAPKRTLKPCTDRIGLFMLTPCAHRSVAAKPSRHSRSCRGAKESRRRQTSCR